MKQPRGSWSSAWTLPLLLQILQPMHRESSPICGNHRSGFKYRDDGQAPHRPNSRPVRCMALNARLVTQSAVAARSSGASNLPLRAVRCPSLHTVEDRTQTYSGSARSKSNRPAPHAEFLLGPPAFRSPSSIQDLSQWLASFQPRFAPPYPQTTRIQALSRNRPSTGHELISHHAGY